ncbi:MAG: hypothetical protein KKD18_05360 [Nanoarchaeota archaeon]|nr:hypothetical protein [Nanoarchaeota archaeon]MBU0977818.1 hypothetical protein [Nanoarchaeota archaeon]
MRRRPGCSINAAYARTRVASKVRETMGGMLVGDFCAEHFRKMGFSSAYGMIMYLSSVRAGELYGAAPKVGRDSPFTQAELVRLPKLFQILGISTSDPVIGNIRSVQPRFTYTGNEGDIRPFRFLGS